VTNYPSRRVNLSVNKVTSIILSVVPVLPCDKDPKCTSEIWSRVRASESTQNGHFGIIGHVRSDIEQGLGHNLVEQGSSGQLTIA